MYTLADQNFVLEIIGHKKAIPTLPLKVEDRFEPTPPEICDACF